MYNTKIIIFGEVTYYMISNAYSSRYNRPYSYEIVYIISGVLFLNCQTGAVQYYYHVQSLNKTLISLSTD